MANVKQPVPGTSTSSTSSPAPAPSNTNGDGGDVKKTSTTAPVTSGGEPKTIENKTGDDESTQLKEQLAKLQEQLTAAQQEKVATEKTLAEREATIKQLEGLVAGAKALQAQVQDLTQKLAEAKKAGGDVTAIQAELEKQKALLAEKEKALASAQEKFGEVSQKVGSLQTQLDKATEKKDALKGQVGDLQTQLKEKGGEIAELKEAGDKEKLPVGGEPKKSITEQGLEAILGADDKGTAISAAVNAVIEKLQKDKVVGDLKGNLQEALDPSKPHVTDKQLEGALNTAISSAFGKFEGKLTEKLGELDKNIKPNSLQGMAFKAVKEGVLKQINDNKGVWLEAFGKKDIPGLSVEHDKMLFDFLGKAVAAVNDPLEALKQKPTTLVGKLVYSIAAASASFYFSAKYTAEIMASLPETILGIVDVLDKWTGDYGIAIMAAVSASILAFIYNTWRNRGVQGPVVDLKKAPALNKPQQGDAPEGAPALEGQPGDEGEPAPGEGGQPAVAPVPEPVQ